MAGPPSYREQTEFMCAYLKDYHQKPPTRATVQRQTYPAT